MTRQDTAQGMGEEQAPAWVTLVGRLAQAPATIRTPSGVTVTMLTLASAAQTHRLVTFGAQAERAAELAPDQPLYVEGRWQAREEGRRELVVSVLQVIGPRPRA
jgi:single-stranded DNA-binding protein